MIRPVRSKDDAGVIKSAQTNTAFLSDRVMVKLFSGDNRFSFKELKQPQPDGKPITVYIVWPASKADYAKASELVITSGMNAVLTSSNKKPGVLFICDEFANALAKKGGGVECIRKAFAFGRDAGLKVQVVLQTIGQLFSMLPDEKNVDEMLGAAGLFQAFGAEDQTTIDLLIKMAANETVWGSARTPYKPRPDSPMDGWQEAGQTPQPKPLLTAHDLGEMKSQDGQIMWLSGLPFPFAMKRQHYFQVTELRARADIDPYHE